MKIEKNSVELWAKEFAVAKHGKEMNEETVRTFIGVCSQEKEINEDKKLISHLNSNDGEATYARVFYRRIKAFELGYTVTPAVCFLAELFIKNFAHSTMLVAYMAYVAKKQGIKEFDCGNFARFVLPFGMPSEEECERLWKLQKIDIADRKNRMIDNVLDYRDAYLTLLEDETKDEKETDNNG